MRRAYSLVCSTKVCRGTKMTEEKLAEQYATKNKEVYGGDEYGDITDYNNIKQAFLAGLKTNKLKWLKSASTEDMLKELKDRGVIRSWYYNGSYHVGNELPKE